MSGPARTPTALRVIRGDKRPRPKDEPEPECIAPVCPDYVAADPIAKKMWDDYSPLLLRLGVLTEADGLSFGALCMAHSFFIQNLRKVIEQNSKPGGTGVGGMVIPTKTGYLAVNQLYTNARDAMNLEQKLWQEFGLSPSSRSKVKASKTAGRKNKFSEFVPGA